jgi:hypothetical protein
MVFCQPCALSGLRSARIMSSLYPHHVFVLPAPSTRSYPHHVFALLPVSRLRPYSIRSSLCPHQVLALPASCLRPARIKSSPCPHHIFALPSSSPRPAALIMSSPFPHQVLALPASCLRPSHITPCPHHVFALPASYLRSVRIKIFSNPTSRLRSRIVLILLNLQQSAVGTARSSRM